MYGDTQNTGVTRSQCSLDISTFRISYKVMTHIKCVYVHTDLYMKLHTELGHLCINRIFAGSVKSIATQELVLAQQLSSRGLYHILEFN